MVMDTLDLIHHFLNITPAILWYEDELRTRARWAQRRLRRQMEHLRVIYTTKDSDAA
jgi:hypothetical protein